MLDDPRLLVVDDEEVICRGCRRIFSSQGFQVETSTDAREGLSLAVERDYAAVLLDIKMPAMDGIQFLEELREKRPEVPVVIITGYPSLPNVASAMRLGASDYVTKPFTPEEITRAVRGLVPHRDTSDTASKDESETSPPPAEPWVPADKEFRFFEGSWLQIGQGGTMRVGVLPTRTQAMGIEAVCLPRIGDTVHQGLPLAGMRSADPRSPLTVPSPISGVVVAVNERLAECPSALWSDPCGDGWVACLSPTRSEEEVEACALRRVILLNPDPASAQDQCGKLTSLGCQVRVVESWEALSPVLPEAEGSVLVMDAFWFGEHGPGLVARINAAAPSMKIVVAASPRSHWETAYRDRKIFYYALEPFADNEIVDVLDAAFRPQGQPPLPAERLGASSDSMSRIRITNRNGKRVCLLAASGLLRRSEGLGRQIRRRLLDRLYPVETRLGSARLTTIAILETANTCDRLLVLQARDTGRLPGSLVHDTKGGFVSLPGENMGKITTLIVQPDSHGGGPLEFDVRTTAALAEHIVRDMASG